VDGNLELWRRVEVESVKVERYRGVEVKRLQPKVLGIEVVRYVRRRG
jgi:hypothetical protein